MYILGFTWKYTAMPFEWRRHVVLADRRALPPRRTLASTSRNGHLGSDQGTLKLHPTIDSLRTTIQFRTSHQMVRPGHWVKPCKTLEVLAGKR
jgi:hypothetical protein